MATLIVTNLNGAGADSLRQALADAQTMAGADTITFAPGLSGGAIRLASQLVVAPGDTNNNGIGDAGDTSILRVAAGSDVGIDGLTFARGLAQGV